MGAKTTCEQHFWFLWLCRNTACQSPQNPLHFARCDITTLSSPLIPTSPPLPPLSLSINECATREHHPRIPRIYGSTTKQRLADGPASDLSSRLGECVDAEMLTGADSGWKIQTHSDSDTYVDDADDPRSSSSRSTLSGARSIINSDESQNPDSVSLWSSSTSHAPELTSMLSLAHISSTRRCSFAANLLLIFLQSQE